MEKKKLNFILFLCKKCKILSDGKYIPSFYCENVNNYL